MCRRRNRGFFSGLLFGAAVAGIAALLYTPKTGKELRKDLSKELNHLKDRINEYSDYAVERGVEMYDVASNKTAEITVNLKESAAQLKSQLTEFAQDANNEIQKRTSEFVEGFQQTQEDAQDALNEVV